MVFKKQITINPLKTGDFLLFTTKKYGIIFQKWLKKQGLPH